MLKASSETSSHLSGNPGRSLRPVCRGNPDLKRAIRTLDGISGQGPVVLQDYKIPGPDRNRLKMSVES